ncbi:Mitochondrial inner membrane protease atp23, partial [Knufia peltigerae]
MTATDHPSSSSASLANAAQPPTSVSSSGASPGAKGHTLLPSDTIWNRWVNFYRMARGTMSEQGAEEYWKDADQRYSKIDCA